MVIIHIKKEKLCEVVSRLSWNNTHCNLNVIYMLIMNEIGISNPENFSCFELVEWEYMVINLNMKQKNKRNSNITKF